MAHISTMQELESIAPQFNLQNFNPNINDAIISIDNFSKFPAFLVVFLCNHCPYVIHIRDSFINFALEYFEKGLGVVAINSNDIETYPEDGPEEMIEYAKKYNLPFPYLFDNTQEIAKEYKAACTPDFFLYDNKRKLVYRGQYDSSRPKNEIPVTGEDLRKATNALIQGSLLKNKQKPSMGCNIKWKKGSEPDYFKK